MPRFLPSLLAALLATACVGDLANLVSLQKDLLEEFPGTEINVSVTERTLHVSMRNGTAVEMAEPEQVELARHVGRRVLSHYPRAHTMESISVSFGTAERAGPLALTNDSQRFRFTPAELEYTDEPAQGELVETAHSTF